MKIFTNEPKLRFVAGLAFLLPVLLLSLQQRAFPQTPDKATLIAAAEKAVAEAAGAQAKDAPGCAVGVSFEGESVFEKAFGLAELEHKFPVRPDTIFESGSVAKQFTAAALVLLEIDGKLDLDDPVRKYIRELPDYGVPMTMRHLLNHTSGLRDWGSVMGMTGVGRGDRIVKQDYAMHVITRQRGLDFVPGAEYSYSNSGYTLASTIVERVSGKSLPEFTKERLFEPIGMKNTSWRDDYTRLVPGRAQAYGGPREGPWVLEMPFMDVYGNAGMLTTIGDFLKWNAALDSGQWQTMTDMLETQGVLNDGRKISYALGLGVGEYKGIRQVSHGGRTGGYVTYLVRYPDQKVSIAVLCNAPSNNPSGIANKIADSFVGPVPPGPQIETASPRPEELKPYAGLWRHEKTRFPVTTALSEDGKSLKIGNADAKLLLDGSFAAAGGSVRITFEFDGDGRRAAMVRTAGENVDRFLAVEEWKPTEAELKAIEGIWYSDEADAIIRLTAKEGKLVIRLESLRELTFEPSYKDHFILPAGVMFWVTRNRRGEVVGLNAGTGRMRYLPFVQVAR